jgi:hypothetical protein
MERVVRRKNRVTFSPENVVIRKNGVGFSPRRIVILKNSAAFFVSRVVQALNDAFLSGRCAGGALNGLPGASADAVQDPLLVARQIGGTRRLEAANFSVSERVFEPIFGV